MDFTRRLLMNTKKKTKSRYKSVNYQGIKGIRKDVKNNTYLVEKYIRGKRFNSTFMTIKEAADWKKNFHPSLNLTPLTKLKNKKLVDKLKELGSEFKHQDSLVLKNGNDFGYTFSDVWKLYVSKHLSTVEKSTRDRRLQDAKLFLAGLMDKKMVFMTARFISDYLEQKKEEAVLDPKSLRYSFDGNLKSLKAIFNWYREHVDAQFVNPILKRHKKEGVIRKIPKKKKKMRKHELLLFFDWLEKDDIFWRDLAEVQFYFSGRVQEVAGLQWESIDFVDGIIEIENVAVWGPQKSFQYLKDAPKNGEERFVPMNKRLFSILQRRLEQRRASKVEDTRIGKLVPCDFVFHLEGQPLKYRTICYRYNKALRKAGLGNKYSSTHILRHTMANLVRERLGIEHAQAVGGWKTRELVEHVYTDRPAHLTKDALKNIEDFMAEKENGPPKGPDFSLLKLVKV
jgi:integrase